MKAKMTAICNTGKGKLQTHRLGQSFTVHQQNLFILWESI
jgi:hypothetical protein